MSNVRRILITSALPYANGSLHLGHLVETIMTDIWVRFQKLRGHDCTYLCADDAHGTPVMLSAKKLGQTPEAYVANIQTEHMADFAGFHIGFDYFHTTHSPENQQLSNALYRAFCDKQVIDEKDVQQDYCDDCQMFLPDRFIKGECPSCHALDQYGDACEKCGKTYESHELINPKCATCGTAPVTKTTTHLFFKLATFETQIKAWLDTGVVRPEIRNKLNEWFDSGLRDWCISRDAPYFGFEIPDKPGKYFYVWLDAPVGYMATTLAYATTTGRTVDEFWRNPDVEIHHVIGKDILYFHTLFWPAMLMAADYSLPKAVHVHGFLTVNGEKMSKSRGTFIQAKTYLEKLPPEFLRYYLASKLTPSIDDLDFSAQDFVFKVNADIVNKVVNIGSRLGSIVTKKLGGTLTTIDDEGEALLQSFAPKIDAIAMAYEHFEIATATREIMSIADALNTYIDRHAPWALSTDSPEKASQICTTGLNGLKMLATLLSPILPELTTKIDQFLNTTPATWASIHTRLTHHAIRPYEHLAKRLELTDVTILTNQP